MSRRMRAVCHLRAKAAGCELQGAIIRSLRHSARALRRRQGAAERGSATVHAAAQMLALAVLLAVVLEAASVVQARHWAHAGADLGAIAAAQTVAEGGTQADACMRARSVTEANRAVLVSCMRRGEDVEVRVEAGGRYGLPSVRAKGVAGPERR